MKIFKRKIVMKLALFLFIYGYASAAYSELPMPGNFQEDTIYTIVVSRFFDGDPENNYYNRDRIKQGDPHWRGDFKGLISKLAYIKDLGFTTICITPPVENRGSLDFTGFYAYDFMKFDPRLESSDANFHDLIVAAHETSLRVIQTLVINHTSNYGLRNQFFIPRLPIKFYKVETEPTFPYVFNWGDYKHPFRMNNDNPCAPVWFKDFLYRDPWAAGPLIDPETGTSLPQAGFPSERFFGTNESQLSRDWYHKSGWLNSSENLIQTSVQFKHLSENSIDLATENWKVKNYILAAVKKYLDLGVDGFRFQFARNIPRDDILIMLEELKKLKPGIRLFADVSPELNGFGPLKNEIEPAQLCPWWYTRDTSITTEPDAGKDTGLTVMDYPLFKSFQTSLTKGIYTGIDEVLQMDFVYGNPLNLITFFHNFEMGPEEGNLTRFAGESWKAANAYTLLWTMRGIPCLYYGEEIEFQKGMPQKLIAPTDTLDMTGYAYFGDNLTESIIATTQSNPMYQHIKRLNLIRSSVPALRMGSLENGDEFTSGMSFVRNYQNGKSYAVVGLASFIDQTIVVERVLPGQYQDAVTGNIIEVATATRRIEFDVKANSAGIYILRGSGKIGEDGDYLR